MTAPLLFSVDLEGAARVPELAARLLALLARHDVRATFFVLGAVARAHPDLVRRIGGEGHEIACHSDTHVPLDRQDRAAFARDLDRNLDALAAAGAREVAGYRAPCFSLTSATAWAYEAMAARGLAWSSSVLPARNPLHGWPGFGAAPRVMGDIVEMPVSLIRLGPLSVPIGGTYLRVLPFVLLRAALARRLRRGEAVLSYVHPYDLDAAGGDEDFGFARWSPFGLLMRLGRGGMEARIEHMLAMGFTPATYGETAERLRASSGLEGN